MEKKFSPKIVLVGAGQIGGTLAILSMLERLSNNVVLLDVIDGLPQGKALDLTHCAGVHNVPCHMEGMCDLSAVSLGLKDADVVIITAGVPRKPGMSRDDLLGINGKIIKGLGLAIKTQCAEAFVICITNPLDAMVNLLQQTSGLPHQRVVGMAGVLDTARFRSHLSEALNVSVTCIHSLVLGGHGDLMVPLLNYTSVAGVPIKTLVEQKWISQEELDKIVERTRQSGGEIVSLMKQGSAFYAPACAALEMVESYIRDERKILCCAAHLNGEYGVTGIYAGVPVIIGKHGVEKVLEYPLTETEKQLFNKSVDAVRELCEACNKVNA